MSPPFTEAVRLVEALLFASAKPMDAAALAERLPAGTDLDAVLRRLAALYDGRGVVLMNVAGGWAFRTAPDLALRLRSEAIEPRRLSRAAVETLAIVAYHQPVTRTEIEQIRGVATSKGTLDQLMETGWVRPGRRRQTPGRPLTWITTEDFLDHFALASANDLPGLEELAAAGLIDRGPAVATLPGGLLPGLEDQLPLLDTVGAVDGDAEAPDTADAAEEEP